MKRFLGIALLVVLISLMACSISEEAEKGRIQAKEDYYADIAAAHSEGYDEGYYYGYGEGFSDGQDDGYEHGFVQGYEEGYYACLEEHGLTEPSETRGFARIEKEPD